MRERDIGKSMIIAGVDQDWALCVDTYAGLSGEDRRTVAARLLGDRRRLPDHLEQFISNLTATAFLETGLRWAQRQEEVGADSPG